jgi:transcriptional regulator with XRE-family HTH domain
MTKPNHPDRNTSEEPDWVRLVESIQCRLYLSQLDIAKHCGVARQTVSAWTNCRRNPGLRARRALMELAARAEAVAGVSVPEEPVPVENRRLRDAHDLGVLVGQLSGRSLELLLDFARSLAERQKT